MKLWRRSMLLHIVAFLTASPAYSASDAVGALEKPEIVVAYPQPSGVFTPLFVASDAGLFKKYGLNVKLQQLNPQLSVQSVVSGSADMSVAAGDLVNASLQGAKIKLVGSSMSQLVFQLWTAKEITNVQQLKGKTLAGTTPRSVLEIATREALKRQGLSFNSDYKLIYMQSVPAVLTAIVSGKAAGWCAIGADDVEGQRRRLDHAGRHRQGEHSRLCPWRMASPNKFIKQNPNTISAFLKGIAEGVARTKNDPAAAKRAIAKFTQTEDAKAIDDTYDFYAPYFVTHLALRPEQLSTWFGYLDETEYPAAAKANPQRFLRQLVCRGVGEGGILSEARFQ